MTENENAVLIGTQDGNGQMNFEGFDLPRHEYITQPTTTQLGIERFLMYGKENSLSVKELQKLTELHPRQITRAVQEARRRGIPVLSTAHPGGYYLAKDQAEKEQCIRSLRHRENETRRTRICLEYSKIEA